MGRAEGAAMVAWEALCLGGRGDRSRGKETRLGGLVVLGWVAV